MDNNRHWQGKSGGGTLGQKSLLIIFRFFDVRVGYAVLYIVIPFYMLFARKGYRAIYDYFRCRVGLSPMKAFGATYHNHLLFGKVLLDRFAVFAGRGSQFRVEIEGGELFDRFMSDPRGCLLASAHVGNSEIVGYLLRNDVKPTNAVIFGGEARVMQQNRERIIAQQNMRFIPVCEDMSHIFELSRAARQGEVIIMPCDRVFGNGRYVKLDFMGGSAQFPIGGFSLAEKYNLNILTLFVIKCPGCLYKVYLSEIAHDNASVMAENYKTVLEKIMKQYPHQWFNFYDFWNN